MTSCVLPTPKFIQESIATQIKCRIQYSITATQAVSTGLHDITVFIRIVAAATINFSLAGVRLLIEGSSYSRVAFIYFGGIPLHQSGGILL